VCVFASECMSRGRERQSEGVCVCVCVFARECMSSLCSKVFSKVTLLLVCFFFFASVCMSSHLTHMAGSHSRAHAPSLLSRACTLSLECMSSLCSKLCSKVCSKVCRKVSSKVAHAPSLLSDSHASSPSRACGLPLSHVSPVSLTRARYVCVCVNPRT